VLEPPWQARSRSCNHWATGHKVAAKVALALWRVWRHNGGVPSIQIKDVPVETHAVLRLRAAAAHQSLQEYLRARLIEEAGRPTLEEVLDRAAGRAGGSVPLAGAVAAVRDERARR
jgi:plasmid stability protein